MSSKYVGVCFAQALQILTLCNTTGTGLQFSPAGVLIIMVNIYTGMSNLAKLV